LMRRSTFVRFIAAASGVLALWLAGTSVAEAAQTRRHRHHQRPAGRVCDSSRPFAPRAGTYSTPVKRLVRRHIFPHLQRIQLKPLVDDDAAIQNGAAIREHDNRRLLADLEPIGVLHASHVELFSHRNVSRRSPRGPPRIDMA
jgi:hypothetical protein